MDDTLLPRLRKAVQKFINQANDTGALERQEFKHSDARQAACKALGLGNDGLEEKQWKSKVKEMVQEAIDELAQDDESNAASGSRSPQKTREKIKSTTGKRQKKRSTPPPTPSPSLSSEASSSRRSKGNRSKKSKGESPDIEGSPGDDEDDDVVDGSEGEAPKDERVASESEMSSVYDVAPTRKKRKGGGDDTGDEKKKSKVTKRKKKDPNEGLSPDEVKVADLKRIVVACGVRKQWSKEFADYPTAQDQIRHLESLLIELGMKGKPSIGKAKTLKEQRELAAELNDVRQFEAARGVSAADTKAKRRRKSSTAEGDDDDVPQPQSAMAAVMDFFDDESD